ncbi:single-stranded DNA-binding protein [Sphingobium sp. AS12]|uniref:single-stranded DNA-binding protein n=1 Tax=Sphingobium sp. AS12 TaxID=2849495 RepID=UPI001C31BE32|nr:single-stranded DNA-binding protein [Sphingobium sp. AS12]MBV2149942.1 single-stranded DNA-binding protein [Sphingobium sp. AS12]
MIDFKRLANETPEERAARAAEREAERQKAEIEADAARRAEWSKKTVIAQLTEDVEWRSTRSGDDVATLRCYGGEGDYTASYWLPPHKPEVREVLARSLRKGVTVVLKGYWKTREWDDRDGQRRASKEFQAQFIARGREALPDFP